MEDFYGKGVGQDVISKRKEGIGSGKVSSPWWGKAGGVYHADDLFFWEMDKAHVTDYLIGAEQKTD